MTTGTRGLVSAQQINLISGTANWRQWRGGAGAGVGAAEAAAVEERGAVLWCGAGPVSDRPPVLFGWTGVRPAWMFYQRVTLQRQAEIGFLLLTLMQASNPSTVSYTATLEYSAHFYTVTVWLLQSPIKMSSPLEAA